MSAPTPSLDTVVKQQTAQDVRDVADTLRVLVGDANVGRVRISKDVLDRVRASLVTLERAERNTAQWLP